MAPILSALQMVMSVTSRRHSPDINQNQHPLLWFVTKLRSFPLKTKHIQMNNKRKSHAAQLKANNQRTKCLCANIHTLQQLSSESSESQSPTQSNKLSDWVFSHEGVSVLCSHVQSKPCASPCMEGVGHTRVHAGTAPVQGPVVSGSGGSIGCCPVQKRVVTTDATLTGWGVFRVSTHPHYLSEAFSGFFLPEMLPYVFAAPLCPDSNRQHNDGNIYKLMGGGLALFPFAFAGVQTDPVGIQSVPLSQGDACSTYFELWYIGSKYEPIYWKQYIKVHFIVI